MTAALGGPGRRPALLLLTPASRSAAGRSRNSVQRIRQKVRYSALTRGSCPSCLDRVITPPPPYDEAALGRAIARARLAAGLTLEQAAERSGVSRRHIIDIERAIKTPTVPILYAIAYSLGVRVGTLADAGDLTQADRPTHSD